MTIYMTTYDYKVETADSLVQMTNQLSQLSARGWDPFHIVNMGDGTKVVVMRRKVMDREKFLHGMAKVVRQVLDKPDDGDDYERYHDLKDAVAPLLNYVISNYRE